MTLKYIAINGIDNMFTYLEPSWQRLPIQWQEFLKNNCLNELIAIDQKLVESGKINTIYPPRENIFHALEKISPPATKVVILGQDPYHGKHEAYGLAFAVNPGVKIPPSLRNIFKELIFEYDPPHFNPDGRLLELWAEQGVLLLNAALTVVKDQANSHAQIGWHYITDQIIQYIGEQSPHCVFMLWGNYARSKKPLIISDKHLVLESVHPSPLSASRGFFGCNHFKLANEFLEKMQLSPINWLG